MSRKCRAYGVRMLLLAGLVAFVWWAMHEVPLLDWVSDLQKRVGEMEFWGGFLYPFLFAACNILLLPGGIIAVGSGILFGLWWGFTLNLIGAVMGAAASFGIARTVGRRWIERRMFSNPKWLALDEAVEREGWKIIFLSQVHPLFPTSLLNYLYGVTRIRFLTCLLWIAIGQAPGLFLYAYLGTMTQIGLRVVKGEAHPKLADYFSWSGGLVISVFATIWLGRLALRLLAEAEDRAARTLAVEVIKEYQPQLEESGI